MLPGRDQPHLWAYWVDFPEDFTCWKGDDVEFVRAWIVALNNGDAGWQSAELDKMLFAELEKLGYQ